jgi:hypothetical protein
MNSKMNSESSDSGEPPADFTEFLGKLDCDSKAEHAKNAIFFFFLFGFLILMVSKRPLFSLATPVFFFFGMFIASLLSIPTYLIKMFVSRRITMGARLQSTMDMVLV